MKRNPFDSPITIIGASGFVGGTLIDALTDAQAAVVGIDLRPSVSHRPIRRANILDLSELTDAIPTGSTVVHLAGPVAGSFGKDFESAWRLQVDGTSNVLFAAARKSCPRIVFASSYHVYMPCPIDDEVDEETAIPASHQDPFGSAKLIAEHMTQSFCAHRDIELVTLRFGSVYGLGNCTNLMGDLFSAAEMGNTVEIWGRGERTNHYVYLDDLAQGCMLALSARPGLYNVLDQRRLTVGEVCAVAEDALGVRSTFRTDMTERPSFPTIRADKFMKETGWQPTSLFESFSRISRQITRARVA